MRSGNVERKTLETGISAEWCLDGSGSCEINTGIGFFDHMLTLLAKHSFSDLVMHAVGDLDVDSHHTVEDCGIVLGQALKEAVGDKAGIHRYGNCFLPMDEALVQVCGLAKYKFRLTLSAGETPMLTLKLKPGADVLETALELVEDLKLATQALEKA